VAGRRSVTTTSSEDLLKLGEKHVTKGLGRLTDVILTRGEGSYVTTHEGKRMLDFTCGIGVTNLGK
jgi:4-aminobutyrate aminotransferase